MLSSACCQSWGTGWRDLGTGDSIHGRVSRRTSTVDSTAFRHRSLLVAAAGEFRAAIPSGVRFFPILSGFLSTVVISHRVGTVYCNRFERNGLTGGSPLTKACSDSFSSSHEKHSCYE